MEGRKGFSEEGTLGIYLKADVISNLCKKLKRKSAMYKIIYVITLFQKAHKL